MFSSDTLPLFTYLIIGCTCLISAVAFQNHAMMENNLHFPAVEKRGKQWHRLLTAGFLHADFIHLAFNMYALYGFGGIVESWFQSEVPGGRNTYLLFYLVAIVLPNLVTYMKHRDNGGFRSLGASGAVSAVLFASILIYPEMRLMIMFIPIPITGYVFAILYLLYSSYASKNNNDRIDHEAHFWGALVGLAVPLLFQPQLLSRLIETVLG